MNSEAWWIDSDTLVEVQELKNAVTSAYINNAVVTGSLTDADGEPVAGAQDIAFSYVAASDGRYVAEVPHGLTLVEDAEYVLTITATGAGFQLVVKVARAAAFKKG